MRESYFHSKQKLIIFTIDLEKTKIVLNILNVLHTMISTRFTNPAIRPWYHVENTYEEMLKITYKREILLQFLGEPYKIKNDN